MIVSVRTCDLQTGMLVTRDIKDTHGRLLVPAGVKTSAKHLKVLKIWGVSEVFIQGASGFGKKADSMKNMDLKRKNEIEKEMRNLFCRQDMNDPVIKELISICIQRKLNAVRAI